MVAEVVLLVAGQQVARVDAKGVVTLMADGLLFAEGNDRRDPVGKAVGGQCLFLELDVGAGVVSKPKAPVAIAVARGKDGREADFCCKVDESPFGARTSPSTRVQKWLPRPTVRCQFILFGVHSQVASSRCMKNHPVLHGK